MGKTIPLSVLMEDTRGKLIQAFNQVIEETKLPAYLYEGMLLEILADVRSRKNMELVFEINKMNNAEIPKAVESNG